MSIDIDAEMAALAAKEGEFYAELEGPGEVLGKILRQGTMRDFREFFARYKSKTLYHLCEYSDRISDPEWMNSFESAHLEWLYRGLVCGDGLLKCTAGIVADRRIVAWKRAYLCHAVFTGRTIGGRSESLLPELWWYNRRAFDNRIRSIRADSADAHVRRLALGSPAKDRDFSEGIAEAVRRDSVSFFEINRAIDGLRIGDALVSMLIRHDAVKCLNHVFANHSGAVFKLRTPGEWLLTVCRCAGDEIAAAAAANGLERQFPGLAASTRDPWGNTPLWNTLFNRRALWELRDELIRLGCDPDAENAWGLSYRLLMENRPDEDIGQ